LKIRMKVASGTKGRIYWTNEDVQNWAENCATHFEVIADGAFHEYTLPLKGHPGWKGTIQQFRFHPSEKTGRVEIDYFKTFNLNERTSEVLK